MNEFFLKEAFLLGVENVYVIKRNGFHEGITEKYKQASILLSIQYVPKLLNIEMCKNGSITDYQ